jgi:single-strand DNA-binding protein
VVWQEGLVKIIEQYVKKGSKIMVEGKMVTRKWQDQSGADRYATEVVLQGFGAQLILLGDGGGRRGGGADDDADAPQQSSGTGYRGGSAGSKASSFANDIDDEIPFNAEFR